MDRTPSILASKEHDMTARSTAVRMAAWQKTPSGKASNKRAKAKYNEKKKLQNKKLQNKIEKGLTYNSENLTSAMNFWGAA